MIILKKAQKKFLARIGLVIGIFLFAIAKFFGVGIFNASEKSNNFINTPTVRADTPTYDNGSGGHDGNGPGADGTSSSSCAGESSSSCPS